MGGRNCLKNDKFNSFNKAVKVRRLTAARLHKNVFGLTPFVHFCSATFLRLLELLRNSFIATAKTSFTCSRCQTPNSVRIFTTELHGVTRRKKIIVSELRVTPCTPWLYSSKGNAPVSDTIFRFILRRNFYFIEKRDILDIWDLPLISILRLLITE